jgi:hypothetical protein
VIDYNDNNLFVGMKGSGKSELCNWFWSQLRIRRVLIDSKHEWTIPGVPVQTLHSHDAAAAHRELEAIDWEQPIVHVRPFWLGRSAGGRAEGTREQLEALFGKLAELPGPLKVTIHEAYAVSSAGWAPSGLVSLAVAGRAHERSLDTCTQRPANIAVELRTEVDNVFLFPPLDREDLRESLRGVPFLSPDEARELARELPKHGYILADRENRRKMIGDPLPDYLRAETAKRIRRVTPR